jgi:hypothetical protein
MLMDLAPCIFLLCMIDIGMHIALERPIAAGRVRLQPTARVDGEVRRLLHGLHGNIFGRLEDDRPLATDPGDERRTVFVVVSPPGLALLAAPTRSAAQMLFPALLRLPLLASGVREFIRFHGALHLPRQLVGQGGIAQAPAPAIARADMDAHLPGDAPRRARQTEQKGGEHPVREGALAAVQACAREVIEGALAVPLFTAVAFQARLVVIRSPGTHVVALTSGALQGPIFPAQRMDVSLTRSLNLSEFVDG